MPPHPTRANRTGSDISALLDQSPGRLADRVGQELDVRLAVPLVPGEDEHALQRLEGAGEVLASVVEGLGAGQGEGELTVAEGAPLLEDRAAERGLLDVPGRRRDARLPEDVGHGGRAPIDDATVDPQGILPV